MKIQFSGFLAFALTVPLWASHGTLSSTDRDPWISARLYDLVSGGLVDKPSQPLGELTNLQVVQLTAQAAQKVMAQADILPPSTLPGEPSLPGPAAAPADTSSQDSKSLKELVEEFKNELSAMDLDLARLEDKLDENRRRRLHFEDLQQEYLKRTGSDMYGYSRGFFNTFRGFGANALYGNMDYNDAMLIDFGLKSVPVPFVLFDARLRVVRTIGLYYVDPITPQLLLRWISLTNFNELGSFTAGDFYQKYTRLTLWNYEVPVYTFIEPTSFNRTRKDLEEFVYMDHGTDWHMRGLRASTAVAWPGSPVLSYFKLQTMAGQMKSATQDSFASYYAGSQASLSFFNDNLEFKGTGLLLWDDPNSASVPYDPNLPLSFPRQYQIGSGSLRATLPLADKFSLSGSAEGAFSKYQDDDNNSQRFFQDWAVLADGSLNIEGAHLTAKYMNIGPFFYSPGAQTNRYSALPGAQGYLSTNLYLDNGVVGYLNDYVFQGVNRPAFAIYDRMVENILPYGDSTPNRLGMIFGLSMDIGKDGWLTPQASYVLNTPGLGMHEIQANFVLNSLGNGAVAVENNNQFTQPRTFGGWEAAVSADIAKGLGEKEKRYFLAFDYKTQTTDLGLGNPFETRVFIGSADFSFPGTALVASAAYQYAQSSGDEYILTGQGNPSTYANYPFYLDTSSIGGYSYTALNIKKTTWAFGLELPLASNIRFKGDLFLNQYTWSDVPGYDRREQIWRASYEVSF